MSSFRHARLGLTRLRWLLAFLALRPAFAQLTNSPALALPPSSGSSALAALRVLGALALVLAVFFGGIWLFRNWERFRIRHGRAPKLAVFETKSLGPRHTLYVIGYEQERMLIAASPNGVTLLTALPRGELELSAPLASPLPSPTTSFGSVLQALAARS